MVWIFLLVLLVVCIFTAILYDRHNLKRRLEDALETDLMMLREATDGSQFASGSRSSLPALEQVGYALRTVLDLIRRYQGIKRASDHVGIDVGAYMRTLMLQRDRIRRYCAKIAPELCSSGELIKYSAYCAQHEALEEEHDEK